ncbi:MAG: hypothetical protein R3E32_08225 [Chitinophagales bacterium]
MIKTKWLIYTVAIGLLPFLLRLLMFVVGKNAGYDFLMNESDFITFGLVLNLTNLNELEHKKESVWKTQMIGLAAIQVAVYAGILVISYITEFPKQEIIRPHILFYCSLILSIISFIFSYSIYDRLNKLSINEQS